MNSIVKSVQINIYPIQDDLIKCFITIALDSTIRKIHEK
jgi:hypothetical protein